MDGCQVHLGRHRPQPLRLVVHHIQPLGMGGPDIAANKVVTCDNGHFSIHRLMGDLLHGLPMRRGGTKVERRLALLGYTMWVTAGKPGQPVYETHWHATEATGETP